MGALRPKEAGEMAMKSKGKMGASKKGGVQGVAFKDAIVKKAC